MRLREQGKTAVFGVAIIIFAVVNAKTAIFMSDTNSKVFEFYDPLSLTIVATGLFINFWIGFVGLFIVMAFNNFLTRNLPNAIGCYEKIKILAGGVFLNMMTMAIVNIIVFFNVPISAIHNEIFYWLFGVFLTQGFLLYSCWLVHPDFFNTNFKEFKNKVVSERENKKTMYV